MTFEVESGRGANVPFVLCVQPIICCSIMFEYCSSLHVLSVFGIGFYFRSFGLIDERVIGVMRLEMRQRGEVIFRASVL